MVAMEASENNLFLQIFFKSLLKAVSYRIESHPMYPLSFSSSVMIPSAYGYFRFFIVINDCLIMLTTIKHRRTAGIDPPEAS